MTSARGGFPVGETLLRRRDDGLADIIQPLQFCINRNVLRFGERPQILPLT